MTTTPLKSVTEHPLAMLSSEEVRAATAVLRREDKLTDEVRVHSVILLEPPKAQVLGWTPGQAMERVVKVTLRDPRARLTCEATVSLSSDRLQDWRERTDVQPPITMVELDGCEATVKAHAGWQEAMRRRGVTDFALAQVDPWPTGWFSPEDDPSRHRVMRALTWVRHRPDENGYARPVENLVALVDLDTMEVLGLEDGDPVKIPDASANYSPDDLRQPGNHPHVESRPRLTMQPLDVVQSEGPSFTVEGNLVQWDRWRFRIGFTQREGLVLHTVSFRDHDRWRPILYRGALSELYIPYGDPGLSQYRKNVFDMGEFGLGMWTNSLERGCDCLGEIRYFDGLIADSTGEPVTVQNAICMHEEDDGILWKHFDWKTKTTEVRRSRRLVVSSIATVGNYEYAFYWYFRQDGSIEYEVKLTGIISNGSIDDGVRPTHGTLVAPNVYGPNHQHFFNVRMDMMVDGPDNAVYEVDSVADPEGSANPNGNCWRTVATPLERESTAQRTIDPLRGRYWRIVNRGVRNDLGDPVAYSLMPGDNVGCFFQPDAPGLRRAGYTSHQLWVTAFDPHQMHAAGQYPNQNPGGDGLPKWAGADRPLLDTDLVVWYTMGAHHVPRPEDWPVMPVARIGFMLKPSGFFDYNPAIDLASPNCEQRHTSNGAG